jgi:hypothetical protein
MLCHFYSRGNHVGQFRYHDNTLTYANDKANKIFSNICTDRGTLTVQPDGRVIHIKNGTLETICSYEWDDVDAGVLCRHLIHSICH